MRGCTPTLIKPSEIDIRLRRQLFCCAGGFSLLRNARIVIGAFSRGGVWLPKGHQRIRRGLTHPRRGSILTQVIQLDLSAFIRKIP